MSTSPSYAEIAKNWKLWEEYVDPSGLMTEEQFDQMTEAERLEFIANCFGKEE